MRNGRLEEAFPKEDIFPKLLENRAERNVPRPSAFQSLSSEAGFASARRGILFMFLTSPAFPETKIELLRPQNIRTRLVVFYHGRLDSRALECLMITQIGLLGSQESVGLILGCEFRHVKSDHLKIRTSSCKRGKYVIGSAIDQAFCLAAPHINC